MVYRYDGSFAGFLSCVFLSFARKETPGQILPPEESPLLGGKWVETRQDHARRVEMGLRRKLGEEIWADIRDGYLSCLPGKEGILLRVIQRLFQSGRRAITDYRDPDAAALQKALVMMRQEGHLLEGFLRFSDYSGVLVAVIHPKNGVLPRLAVHFSTRFPQEKFVIYDETHHLAFFHSPTERKFAEIDALTLPPPDQTERLYRALWKGFLSALSIRERENPRCQMTHLPLRYRPWMVEFDREEPTDLSGFALPEGQK